MRRIAILCALLLAGCSTPAAEDTTTAPAPEPTLPTVTVEPFEWTGSFTSGAYVYVSGPVPAGASIIPFGTDVIEPLSDGNVTAVDLTLAWTATSPTTEDLFFLVTPYTSCGNNCYRLVGDRLSTTGPSPLRIAGNVTVGDADGALAFVFPLNSLPSSMAYATVVVDQAWTLTGNVTLVA